VESGIGDKVEGGEFLDGGERCALGVARGAQAGAHLVEVGVVIAGMRDQFPCAGGKLLDERADGGGVECSSAGDADGPIRGGEALFRDDAAAGGVQAAQDIYLGNAHQGRAVGGADGPRGLKGIADGMDACRTGRAQHRAEYCGKHVRVLVGVDMRESEAFGLKQADLRRDFGFNFGRTDSACKEAQQERGQSGLETAGSGVDERGDFAGGKSRFSID